MRVGGGPITSTAESSYSVKIFKFSWINKRQINCWDNNDNTMLSVFVKYLDEFNKSSNVTVSYILQL